MARKKASDTQKLAMKFVTGFLGKKFSYNTDRRFLREAAYYLNPKPDPLTGEDQRKFTLDEVWGCLLDMKSAGIERINSIHAVAWTNKDGKTYLESYCEPEPMPPLYMKEEVAMWAKRHRERQLPAKGKGKADD